MSMSDKKKYISELAVFLSSQNTIMSGEELAKHLNRNNILTSYGKPYKGGRGTYKLIRGTYKWLHDNAKIEEARCVAKVFVKPNGIHAYK